MTGVSSGRPVEHGPTAEVFAHPRETYTKALLASVSTLGSMKGEPAPLRFPEVDMATGSVLVDPDVQDDPTLSAALGTACRILGDVIADIG